MLKPTWIRSARTAVIVMGCWAASIQGPSLVAAQVSSPRTDVKSSSPWENTFVTVLVVGSEKTHAAEKRVAAKTMSVRSPVGAFRISLTAVADPTTGQSYILPSSQFLVSTGTGMYALQFAISSVNVIRGNIGEPTAASGESASFATIATVPLELSAPPAFFVRGSQPVAPDIDAIWPQDRLVQLILSNYAGQTGWFGVDTETWKVSKTEFGKIPSARMRSQFPTVRRADLTKPQSWDNTAVDLVVPTSPTSSRVEKIAAKITQLKFSRPPGYAFLTAIVDPHSGYTHVIHSGQEFYLSRGSDLLAFTVDGGFFHSIQSYFKAETKAGDPDATIARFVTEVDDETLSKKLLDRLHIDLRGAAPFPFFTAGSNGSSQPGKLTTTVIELNKDVLRLDILSDGGRYTGTFWIDLKAERLLRSVVDGKEFFKAK